MADGPDSGGAGVDKLAARFFGAVVSLNLKHPINCGLGVAMAGLACGVGWLLPGIYQQIFCIAGVAVLIYSSVMFAVGLHRTLPSPMTVNGNS